MSELKAKRGDWVQIHNIVLTPEERAPQVPEDTKSVPLEMWVKGFLLEEEAEIGSEVEIKTITGRITRGKMIAINPYYDHNYGKFVPELIQIGLQVREILGGGKEND